MESGPTQGAERHEAALNRRWSSHPWLARLLRVSIVLVPLLLSFAFSLLAGRIAPAEDLGMNRWVWILVVFVLATFLLFVLQSATNRLIPLVALMKLTLVFPDNAPSRTKAALRKSNSRTMLRDMEVARANGATTGEAINGDYLVQLLKEVNDHDRLTRGHSERVRAYSDLLGTELGLNAEDLNKLRWAALLHDVGKLTVPAEILNKQGRPDEDEWKILQNHPAAGIPLLEPLRDWLGDWLHAADQHHCRWDGNGYPSKLGGEDIALSGRLVAIADAYDVMTSARSYKRPLPPEVARQELTDCAGSQFDPHLVRAFLRIGLGRLKTIAGPFAWLANLGGSAQLPIPATHAITTAAASASAAAVAVAVVAASSVFGQAPPEAVAPEPQIAVLEAPAPEQEPDPVIAAQDRSVSTVAGSDLAIVLDAEGPALTFSVGDAVRGVASLASDGVLVTEVDGVQQWRAKASYSADSTYTGQDAFVFEVCNPDGRCDQGMIRVDLAPHRRPDRSRPPRRRCHPFSRPRPPRRAPRPPRSHRPLRPDDLRPRRRPLRPTPRAPRRPRRRHQRRRPPRARCRRS